MRKTLRILIGAFLAIILLVFGSIALLTAGISTDTARSAIEERISSIVGLPVRLAGRTEVHFFPAPYAVFNAVTVTDRSDRQLMRIDRVEADFVLTSLVQSVPTFSAFRLEKPTIFLDRDAQSIIMWPALDRAGQQAAAPDTPPATNDSLTLLDEIRQSLPSAIGRITYRDGTILFRDEGETSSQSVSDLQGNLVWPRRDGTMSISATFNWLARPSSLDLNVGSVSRLFSAEGDTLSVDLSLGAAQLAFSGDAALATPRFATGDLTMSFGSTRTLNRWVDAAPLLTAGVDTLSITGPVALTQQRMRMENATVVVNDVTGNGAVELMTREGGQRVLTATLDFNSLDIGQLTAPAWRAFNRNFEPAAGLRSRLTGFNMDLRVSSDSASIGPLEITDLAGAVSVRDDLISIDVGEASIAGGSVQLRFKDDGAVPEEPVSFLAKLTNVDSQQLSEAVPLGPLFPRGVLNATTDIHGRSGTLLDILRSATGSLRVTSENAVLPGISISDVLNSNDASQFFALQAGDASGDRFDMLEAEFQLLNGALRADGVQVTYPNASLGVRGIISALNASLALTASVQDVSDGVSSTPPIFIGGNLNQPFATFILAPPDQIQ